MKMRFSLGLRPTDYEDELRPASEAEEKLPIEEELPVLGPVCQENYCGISIETAAEKLIAEGAVCAIFLSLERDDTATNAVLVAREVVDAGLRVLLLDLTASGAAAGTMLDGDGYLGSPVSWFPKHSSLI